MATPTSVINFIFQVIEGMDVVETLETLGSQSGQTRAPTFIEKSGQITDE